MVGVLNVNKPPGPTSHDVVARIRRVTHMKRVGHAGTLDPEASGVLLVCLGQATRIVEDLVDWRKSYSATAVMGVETDTEDMTGNILLEKDCSHVDKETVESILSYFTGKILQTPPMVSAVKHQGERLYKLAREGKTVERKPREVEIYSLRLTGFTPGNRPQLTLDVECSKGTYIRTLCADIGKALNCGGYMKSLVRTKIGRFTLEEAVTLDEIEELAAEDRLGEVLRSIDETLSDIHSISVSKLLTEAVRNGVKLSEEHLAHEGLTIPSDITLMRVHDVDGRLIALAEIRGDLETGRHLAPVKVFSESD